jgi:hypothetical protein
MWDEYDEPMPVKAVSAAVSDAVPTAASATPTAPTAASATAAAFVPTAASATAAAFVPTAASATAAAFVPTAASDAWVASTSSSSVSSALLIKNSDYKLQYEDLKTRHDLLIKDYGDLRSQTNETFRQLREALECSICADVCILPKVLGSCGHTICQNCLKHVSARSLFFALDLHVIFEIAFVVCVCVCVYAQKLDDTAFASMSNNPQGVSARKHMLARRCPLCRLEIIGAAFPVIPLKAVSAILMYVAPIFFLSISFDFSALFCLRQFARSH